MKNMRLIILSTLLLLAVILILIELDKSTDLYLYGNSYRQNRIVNTIRLHKYGIIGKGVTIGVMDAGFYTLHPVFSNTEIKKEFDFVTGQSSTINYNHIKGMDHGTNVFSVLGGYKVNDMIGISYGANFILAKTDISTSRLVEEEYNAVEASKWLFENGSQIITISLSFNKFDNADYYYPHQMNGRTALITRIADSLVNKGVIFICSAGNNYEEAWRIVEPPGDGFNVLTVGSVDKNQMHSFFSSCGPTIDGRIKPDIVTPGEGVWSANYLPNMKPEFSWNHGTSLSAPIAAGIVALVLSTHPELALDKVREVIINSSSKSSDPDNLYGWGVPDAEKAVSYFGPAFSNTPEFIVDEDEVEIKTYVFSSFGLEKSSVELHLTGNNTVRPKVYKMQVMEDNYYSRTINFNLEKELRFFFTAKDKRGFATKFPSGFLGEYFILTRNGKEPEIVNQ